MTDVCLKVCISEISATDKNDERFSSWTTSLGKKFILATYRLDALVLFQSP